MKTNKSFTKRLRTTRTGKIMARKPGQDHFNAKDSGSKHAARQRQVAVTFSKRVRNQFIPK